MPKESPLPAEHIGNIPAGHKRDEEIRRRTDTLEQRAEEEGKPFEAIDARKFEQIDNDIAGGLARDPQDGTLRVPFSGAQPDYKYVWLNNPDCYRDMAAEHTAHAKNEAFFSGGSSKIRGGEWVEGDMPEAREFRGKGRNNLSSRRGYGDNLLARIRIDIYEARERWFRQSQARKGNVEQSVIEDMHRYGFTGSADPNHEAFRRSGIPNPGHAIVAEFNEGDLRRGSLKNPIDGRTLEPGYERRQQ